MEKKIEKLMAQNESIILRLIEMSESIITFREKMSDISDKVVSNEGLVDYILDKLEVSEEDRARVLAEKRTWK